MKRNCDNCKKEYEADARNVNRGWGLCCSKSCAASKREKSKPGYNPARVEMNNIRRNNWFDTSFDADHDTEVSMWRNCDPGDSEYWDSKDF